MSGDVVFTLQNVNKSYPMGEEEVHALRNVNLIARKGDFIAVMGPSGSGKSTLMNILGLLDQPDSGSYNLNDMEVGSLDDDERSRLRNQTIGFVFQSFNLLPRATALRNVILPLTYRHNRASERTVLADKALKTVGLDGRKHHLPNQLSGGERQRVAIARALVSSPSLILADEPTGNLDSRTSQDILDMLHQLAEKGQTVIMVTHDPQLSRRATRIITMLDGAIQDEE